MESTQAQATEVEAGSLKAGQRLRLLSYNIQAGIDTSQFRDYLTKGWRHVLPSRQRLHNLDRIARMLRGYDLVGLQEVDSGSLRSGFLDMTEYLAHRAGYPYWYRQVNRDIGMIAQNSNGFLSRIAPSRVAKYRLPPGNGRGAMVLEFGEGAEALQICTVHLALSRRQRRRQLDFLAERLQAARHVVVMGDLNTSCDTTEFRQFVERNGLNEPGCSKPTFPSWRPIRRIDHILVSHSLRVLNARVLDYPLSDHLPVCVEILVPDGLQLAA
ncbi:MAG: EEP domain-containing protein [Gammaproteobacteria bacterium]|nr:MAG: EEP domain-containing protein [Gammaproteobacteria bacterium]